MPRRPSRLGNSRGPGTRREGRGRPGDGGGTERNESCMKEAPRMWGLRMAAKRVLFLESRYEQFFNSTFGLPRLSVKVQQCVIVDLSVPAARFERKGRRVLLFARSVVVPSSFQVGRGRRGREQHSKVSFLSRVRKSGGGGRPKGERRKEKTLSLPQLPPCRDGRGKSETLGFRIGGGDIGVGGTSVFPPSPRVPRRGTAASGPCRSRPRGIVRNCTPEKCFSCYTQ